MCTFLLALGAVAAGASIYGATQSASAAKDEKNALIQQNASDTLAQNQGEQQRLAATHAQTLAQAQAFGNTLTGEQGVSDAMRASQNNALDQQKTLLDTANSQEDTLHGVGTGYANDLLDRTSGANLGQAQADWQTEAANLLSPGGAATWGSSAVPTGDADTDAALARRGAEAASNIRAYGAKAAKVDSYTAPLQLADNAISNTGTGIMPAEAASKLLQTSMPVLAQPAQTAWGNAVNLGQQGINAVQQRGQEEQNIAGLQYQDSTDIANLGQSDATQVADNTAKQALADAAYKKAMAGVYSGIGNMGLQAAGYYGAGTDAKNLFGSLFPGPDPFASNPIQSI